jgi:hypothetical protein
MSRAVASIATSKESAGAIVLDNMMSLLRLDYHLAFPRRHDSAGHFAPKFYPLLLGLVARDLPQSNEPERRCKRRKTAAFQGAMDKPLRVAQISRLLFTHCASGRGAGVGRGLGVGRGCAVGVGLGVAVGVTVGLGVVVGVTLGVAVGVTVAVAVGVGVGVPPTGNG